MFDQVEYQKQYRIKNRERLSAQNKAWREANRDHLRETQHRWYEKNKSEVDQYQRDYRLAHKSEAKQAHQKYQKLRRDEIKERQRVYRQEHPNETHAIAKRGRQKRRLLCLQIVSGLDRPKCVRCNCDDLRFLEINHKNGGGNQENRRLARGNAFQLEIIKGRRKTNDLEVLCKPCNAIHALELKYGSVPLKTVWEGINGKIEIPTH